MIQARATHINANGATTIGGASSHVILRGITINTKGASANTITIAGVAEGTIAVIDSTSAVGHISFFDLRFKDGFTVTLATGTAADITVLHG